MGKINTIRMVQYNQAAVVSLSKPINSVAGCANLAAVEPVIAKTTKITAI